MEQFYMVLFKKYNALKSMGLEFLELLTQIDYAIQYSKLLTLNHISGIIPKLWIGAPMHQVPSKMRVFRI